MKARHIIFLIVLYAIFQPCTGQTQKSIEGSWMGLLPVESSDRNIHVIFNIEKQDNTYKVVMHDPDNMSLNTEGTIAVDDSVRINIRKGYIKFTGFLKNETTIDGTYSQMGYNKNIELIKQKTPLTFNRPQTPNVHSNDYKAEAVTIENTSAKDVKLNGILSYPTEGDNFPVAILIAGSGNLDMDETIADHKIFFVISDYLVKKGIAVLRYDKRGSGKSTGRFDLATTEDFASDVEAVIEYLKTKPFLNKQKIGVIGHSEGGEISFMLGAKRNDISYIVSMAGPGISGKELADTQIRDFANMNNFNDSIKDVNKRLSKALDEVAEAVPYDSIVHNIRHYASLVIKGIPEMKDDDITRYRVIISLINMASPRMRFLLKYDPTENLKKVTCPVFAINGEKDIQINADRNLSRIDSLIRSNGNKHVTIKKYPDLNHLFQHSKTGHLDEYAWIEETISLEVLEDISNWIIKNVK